MVPAASFSIIFIVVLALFPDNSVMLPRTSPGEHYLVVGWGKSGDLDILLNILLFAPLGFSAAGVLTQKRAHMLPMLLWVLALSFGLSYSVETIQNFIPSRFPSFVDVLANSVGGLLGFVCFLLWKKKDVRLSLLVYVVSAFIVSIRLQQAMSFRNWEHTFPLLLGNERTGDRPWRGHVAEIYIADRALSGIEAAMLASEDKHPTALGNSLLAWYRFGGLTRRYRDEMRHLPDLVWKGAPLEGQQVDGIFLGPAHWLETTAPASYLTQRLMETSQFTLGLIVATRDTAQEKAARIVSLSMDLNGRNFTLGQLGGDLVFRLRTPLTGGNGVEPQFIVPGIFSTLEPQHLTITYNGAILSLYVNGSRNPYTLELTPGAAAFGYLLERTPRILRLCKVLYYASISIPLGILLALTAEGMKKQFASQILLLGGGIVLAALVLEILLVSVSGGNMQLENLLMSMIIATGTTVFCILYRAVRRNQVNMRPVKIIRFARREKG